MKLKQYEECVEIPAGIDCKIEGQLVTIKGSKGSLQREFTCPKIKFTKENKEVIFRIGCMTKREKTMLGTIKAHIKNMFRGVSEGYTYKLKICSGHFPMNIVVAKNEVVIKNFVGEKVPRILKLRSGVAVKVEGEVILVESCDNELAGQTAAAIEQLTKRTGYDPRVFQQGCYIFEKAGKEIR